MKKYSKAIIAILGAVATAISTAAVPDSWKTIAAILSAALTTIGVYVVPNAP